MAEELEMEENVEAVEETQEFQDKKNEVMLQTHLMIDRTLSGDLEKLEKGYALVKLQTSEDMRADSVGLVHGGFIFSAADFAAMAAVNEPTVVLAGADCQFLAPVRVGDEVTFEAHVRHSEARKRNVTVTAYSYDVKVFTAEFKTVVTEKHVLKLSLMHAVKEDEE
ncbi:MAG: hotdog domain-containing protein [Sulfurimonadaceae bacterium]|nr:hotdog domain-containing protein [Sulfurimonadaceae bacterium]